MGAYDPRSQNVATTEAEPCSQQRFDRPSHFTDTTVYPCDQPTKLPTNDINYSVLNNISACTSNTMENNNLHITDANTEHCYSTFSLVLLLTYINTNLPLHQQWL